jgi:pimeloyl-ACP methyl ester carboxylesterase
MTHPLINPAGEKFAAVQRHSPVAALARALSFALILSSCAQTQWKPVATNSRTQPLLNIDGNDIWVHKEGSGKVTVVFESGFGNDSSVWSKIAPRVRAAGARIFVYDRAGMGRSTINAATPYSIDNDVHILRTALARSGVDGPIVMVGHSYGGAMCLLAASEDEQIKGIVLIDALVPNAMPKSEVEKNRQAMRAQYDEIRKEAPELAKVAIPFAEALPETSKRIDAIRISDILPVIDIVAENGQNTPTSRQIWRNAHIEFTANNPHREYILAAGISHKVMRDKPKLVVEAILKMIEKTKQEP